jgi:hypothetical protein
MNCWLVIGVNGRYFVLKKERKKNSEKKASRFNVFEPYFTLLL